MYCSREYLIFVFRRLNKQEQNSGLMLLGAVVRRTFGPLLNSMSASTFFRKFPDMYEFLLGEVRSCGERMKEKNLAGQFLDFTFYVLVLLSSFATKGVIEDAHFPVRNLQKSHANVTLFSV